MRYLVHLRLACLFLFLVVYLFIFSLKILQVITQIWVLLLGGLTSAGILDIWVGTSLKTYRIQIQIVNSLITKFFSFTGRAWFPYTFLPCIGWIPAVVYIFRTSFKGSSLKKKFIFSLYLLPLMVIWLSCTIFVVKTKWMDWKLCPWSKLH